MLLTIFRKRSFALFAVSTFSFLAIEGQVLIFRLPQDTAAVTADVLNAIQYLHDVGITHRDLKVPCEPEEHLGPQNHGLRPLAILSQAMIPAFQH